MQGLPEYNYPAFFQAEEQLNKHFQGTAVIHNPARIDELYHQKVRLHNREWYLQRAIKMLMECDSVCLLKGWRLSPGARLEVELAKELGMSFYEFDCDSNTIIKSDLIENIFEDAKMLVSGPRQDAYGPPEKNFNDIGRMWSLQLDLDYDIPAHVVAKMMAGLKLMREKHSPKYDNRLDAVAYLYIADNILNKKQ
jgi:Domain of unknown function (DUF6378)/Domain of unknown function (DUF4406)